ncbi:MAG: flagellar basal body P-ring protein FlgI, partial [Leptospiraceae bacterium]|nr:flagellar basal body P-ring protein FlgI [Leptospiraceae bacterium]
VLNGATIERGVTANLVEPGEQGSERVRLRISLNHFDFTTLDLVRDRLRSELEEADVTVDGGSIIVSLPDDVDPVEYIARVEQIRIVPEYRARVVINERSGTIVMGGDIQIDPVSVSRGGMELIITGDMRDARMGIHVGSDPEAENREVTQEFQGANVQEIIKGLNAMGASVKDIIAILEALRDSGALHAEVIVN